MAHVEKMRVTRRGVGNWSEEVEVEYVVPDLTIHIESGRCPGCKTHCYFFAWSTWWKPFKCLGCWRWLCNDEHPIGPPAPISLPSYYSRPYHVVRYGVRAAA